MKGLLYVLWYVLSSFSKPMKFLYALLALTLVGSLIYKVFFETRIAYVDWREVNFQILASVFLLMLPHYFQSLAVIGKEVIRFGQKQTVRHVRQIRQGHHGISRRAHL